MVLVMQGSAAMLRKFTYQVEILSICPELEAGPKGARPPYSCQEHPIMYEGSSHSAYVFPPIFCQIVKAFYSTNTLISMISRLVEAESGRNSQESASLWFHRPEGLELSPRISNSM